MILTSREAPPEALRALAAGRWDPAVLDDPRINSIDAVELALAAEGIRGGGMALAPFNPPRPLAPAPCFLDSKQNSKTSN